MSGLDTRTVSRDSLFLLANVRVEHESDQHRVRVRNLSDGGMMGEGPMQVSRGNRVEVELRNVGKVQGCVAWVQDNRFGIAFDNEVDSERARKATAGGSTASDKNDDLSKAHRAPPMKTGTVLRKV